MTYCSGLGGQESLHGTLKGDHIPFPQSGAHRHGRVTFQSQFNLFANPAGGTLKEDERLAAFFKNPASGSDYRVLLRVDNDFRTSGKVRNYSRVDLFLIDFQAHRDLTDIG